MRLSAILLVLAGVALSAACDRLPWPPSAPTGNTGAATGATPPPEEAPLAKKAPESPEPKPAPPADQPPPPAFEPEDLIGADRAKVWSTLGTPETVREQNSSTVWAYGDLTCGLDVFFFLDVNDDELRVLTYKLKLTEDSENVRATCLNRLARKDSA